MSLLKGWFTPTMEILALVLFAVALVRSGRRWQVFAIPSVLGVGLITSLICYCAMGAQGWSPGDAPLIVWLSIGGLGAVLAMAAVGWRAGRWWNRTATVVSIPLLALCIGLSVNQWTGYFPTASRAWDGIASEPLPQQTSAQRLAAFRDDQRATAGGRIVPISVPSHLSGFHHRQEYVYLPQRWFTGPTPPHLPALMMIGGVVNTPEDWVRSGSAMATVQNYAATHNGVAPILVFADPSGSMTNDTECVNGPHGNVDTHLADELRPYVVSQFGASANPLQWGVVGWSMGGTCAVDLVTRHPDLFSTFEDISGDIGPNLGNKAQTIAALYGHDASAWDRFNPETVMTTHGEYHHVAGWFQSNGHWSPRHRAFECAQLKAARSLAATASDEGIETVVRAGPGAHSWSYASEAFDDALDWLMQHIWPETPTLPI